MGSDGRWYPGIGDPSIGGWVTVAAYFGAAALSYRALSRQRERSKDRPSVGHPRQLTLFWLFTLAAMVVLGLNKQLDLQSWVTELGRDLARAQGWYEMRRPVQGLFVIVLGVAGLIGMLAALLVMRRTLWQVLGGFLGLSFLATFIAVRAASFHHVDELLGSGVVRLNWVFELGGIALVALSAWQHGRSASDR